MEHAFSPEISQRENRITFLKFQLFPGTFQWNARKTCVPLTSQPEFPVFRSKWRAPHITFKRPSQGFRRFTYVSSLNVKPLVSRIEEESISLLVYCYCLFAFLCRCRSSNPSFCRLSPFLLHYIVAVFMSIVGIYPNWVPALTGPFPGTIKNDRIIKTSNRLIDCQSSYM